jgi:hypothetical protein
MCDVNCSSDSKIHDPLAILITHFPIIPDSNLSKKAKTQINNLTESYSVYGLLLPYVNVSRKDILWIYGMVYDSFNGFGLNGKNWVRNELFIGSEGCRDPMA